MGESKLRGRSGGAGEGKRGRAREEIALLR